MTEVYYWRKVLVALVLSCAHAKKNECTKVAALLMLDTQVGSWLCHTRVWPRINFPFDVAQLTSASEPVNVNWFWTSVKRVSYKFTGKELNELTLSGIPLHGVFLNIVTSEYDSGAGIQ
jgi:hypothetical protein